MSLSIHNLSTAASRERKVSSSDSWIVKFRIGAFNSKLLPSSQLDSMDRALVATPGINSKRFLCRGSIHAANRGVVWYIRILAFSFEHYTKEYRQRMFDNPANRL